MIDLSQVMIFASHPIHRHEMIIRVGLFQINTCVDHRDYFIYKIEWLACENIELMPRGDGECTLIL